LIFLPLRRFHLELQEVGFASLNPPFPKVRECLFHGTQGFFDGDREVLGIGNTCFSDGGVPKHASNRRLRHADRRVRCTVRPNCPEELKSLLQSLQTHGINIFILRLHKHPFNLLFECLEPCSVMSVMNSLLSQETAHFSL